MNDWPDTYDFETDETCQSLFKPFVEAEMAKLAAFDALREKRVRQLRELDEDFPQFTYIFHEHALRVAENVHRTCLALDQGEVVANNMRQILLLHDIGKPMLPVEIWDNKDQPTAEEKALRRTHTNLGADYVLNTFPKIEHPFKSAAIDTMRYHHEQMDGSGPHKIPAAQLPAFIRLAAIVEAYDGWRTERGHYAEENRDTSPEGVLKRMREEKGPDFFDMELFEAFAEMKMNDYKEGRILREDPSCNPS